MNDFALTPPPSPPEIPERGLLTALHQMEGRTVRCVFEIPCGRKADGIQAVIVFDDSTWAPLAAGGDEVDGYSVEIPFWARDYQACDVLSVHEMLEAGLCNHGEAELLRQREADLEAAERTKRAAQLRKELQDLEAQG